MDEDKEPTFDLRSDGGRRDAMKAAPSQDIRRVRLADQFICESGEGRPPGLGTMHHEYDEVQLAVKSGSVTYIVPGETADADIVQDRWLDDYCDVILNLAGGHMLQIRVTAGAIGVDVRLTRAPSH